MEKLGWYVKLIGAVSLDLYNLFFKFMSRKLFFSMFGVMAIGLIFEEAKKSGLSDGIIIWSLPISVICITLIVVSYVTGQAKIDVQANIQGPK